MKFATKLVTIAFVCVSLASATSFTDRFLSASLPDDITVNYPGVSASSGTSQIILLDSGLGNLWIGGSVTANDNCTIILNVTGNGNTIKNPNIICGGNS